MARGGVRRRVGLLGPAVVVALGCGPDTATGGAGTEGTSAGDGGTTSDTDGGGATGGATGSGGSSDGTSGTETSGTGSPGPGSSGSTGTSRPEGCLCIIDEDGSGFDVPQWPTCGVRPCPVVFVAEPAPGTGPEVENPEEVDCALAALRDRTPGVLGWDASYEGGIITDNGYILINEDGSVVRRTWGYNDAFYECGHAQLGELESPDYYDTCLQDPDDMNRFDCFAGPLAHIRGVCDEGWDAEDP